MRTLSSRSIPSFVPVCIRVGIWKVFFSRMSDATAMVPKRISTAGQPPLAVGPPHQPLGHDAAQRLGQHGADLGLLLVGEGVDDPVDGLRRAGGVQRGQDQLPGLRRRDRQLHRLEVAHLPDEDDVRVLAQGRPQRRGERSGAAADLALVDEAVQVRVHVLDRVLDGDDVLVLRCC